MKKEKAKKLYHVVASEAQNEKEVDNYFYDKLRVYTYSGEGKICVDMFAKAKTLETAYKKFANAYNAAVADGVFDGGHMQTLEEWKADVKGEWTLAEDIMWGVSKQGTEVIGAMGYDGEEDGFNDVFYIWFNDSYEAWAKARKENAAAIEAAKKAEELAWAEYQEELKADEVLYSGVDFETDTELEDALYKEADTLNRHCNWLFWNAGNNLNKSVKYAATKRAEANAANAEKIVAEVKGLWEQVKAASANEDTDEDTQADARITELQGEIAEIEKEVDALFEKRFDKNSEITAIMKNQAEIAVKKYGLAEETVECYVVNGIGIDFRVNIGGEVIHSHSVKEFKAKLKAAADVIKRTTSAGNTPLEIDLTPQFDKVAVPVLDLQRFNASPAKFEAGKIYRYAADPAGEKKYFVRVVKVGKASLWYYEDEENPKIKCKIQREVNGEEYAELDTYWHIFVDAKDEVSIDELKDYDLDELGIERSSNDAVEDKGTALERETAKKPEIVAGFALNEDYESGEYEWTFEDFADVTAAYHWLWRQVDEHCFGTQCWWLTIEINGVQAYFFDSESSDPPEISNADIQALEETRVIKIRSAIFLRNCADYAKAARDNSEYFQRERRFQDENRLGRIKFAVNKLWEQVKDTEDAAITELDAEVTDLQTKLNAALKACRKLAEDKLKTVIDGTSDEGILVTGGTLNKKFSAVIRRDCDFEVLTPDNGETFMVDFDIDGNYYKSVSLSYNNFKALMTAINGLVDAIKRGDEEYTFPEA